MAVIVEVPEGSSSKKSKSKDADKGKGIGASERSAAFADYLRKQQEKPARDSSKAKNTQRKPKENKDSFMRPSSQVPEGGWFRNTTSAKGTPPAPANSPEGSDESSSPSSSSDSSSSSSDETSSSDSSSSSNDESSDGKSSSKLSYVQRKLKRKSKKKLEERKQMKKAMAGIKLKAPFVWDGKPDMDLFDHWTYEVDTWIELNALNDKLAVKLIVNFMSGTASSFFMKHVSTNQKKWSVKDVYGALFEYCFPADFKLRLRKRLMGAYQGRKTVRDFVRDLRALAIRFPDVTDRNLVQILWDGAEQYIRIKWLERRMSPEESSFNKLEKWALRFEKSKEALDKEQRDWNPKPKGRTWGRFVNRTTGNKPWIPPADSEGEQDTNVGKSTAEQRKQTDKSKNAGRNGGENNNTSFSGSDKSKGKQNKPRDKPKMSPEELDKLRAEDRCFSCKDVGHQSRNCP
jgi:hypothetical protein